MSPVVFWLIGFITLLTMEVIFLTSDLGVTAKGIGLSIFVFFIALWGLSATRIYKRIF